MRVDRYRPCKAFVHKHIAGLGAVCNRRALLIKIGL